MTWTSEKPTKPGWYWWKAGDHVNNPECMYVVQIKLWRGNLVEAYSMAEPEDGQFAGPLEPPATDGKER